MDNLLRLGSIVVSAVSRLYHASGASSFSKSVKSDRTYRSATNGTTSVVLSCAVSPVCFLIARMACLDLYCSALGCIRRQHLSPLLHLLHSSIAVHHAAFDVKTQIKLNV